MLPGGGRLLTLSRLSVASTARLDLADNDMIIQTADAAKAAEVEAYLAEHRAEVEAAMGRKRR